MINPKDELHRKATLKITHPPDGAVLSAVVPHDITREELVNITSAAIGLITKLTGCQCMSGQYKFVVADRFLSDVMHVDLRTGDLRTGDLRTELG